MKNGTLTPDIFKKLYLEATQQIQLRNDFNLGDKIIYTTHGDFKIRKNGRQLIVLEPNTKKEEYVKVTPIK